MKGGIYSNQKCSICGGRFKSFEPIGIWCQDHPECRPTKIRVKFGKLNRNIHSYEKAYSALNAWRYKTDEGSFDIRDYQHSNPLGFENLARKFIKRKSHLKAVKKYEQRLRFAIETWGNRNVKEIGFAEIEDLILDLINKDYASYYVEHINNTLKMFWNWLAKRREIEPDQKPDFPTVQHSIAYRKILTKEQQRAVLEEIYKLTWDLNPRIFVSVQFMATYIICRPGEILNILEEDIEIENKRIHIPNPKEGESKYIYLIDEDVDFIKSLPKGFPKMHLFRHTKGNGGAKPGERFGPDYIQRYWNKACDNLGIEGVSLYPGTRHTTEVFLREMGHSPESIWRASGTRSNKARQRYLLVTGNELRTLYQDTRLNTALTPRIVSIERGK